MQKYTYERVMASERLQKEFLHHYDRLISHLKKFGYIEAAIIHSKNRKMLIDEIALLN